MSRKVYDHISSLDIAKYIMQDKSKLCSAAQHAMFRKSEGKWWTECPIREHKKQIFY